jgi:hypothetical protein
MGLDPHHGGDIRKTLTLRALWIGLVLFGLSFWALAAAPSLPHRKAFDASAFEQIVKLDHASDERGFKARSDHAAPRHSGPGHEPAPAFAAFYGAGEPAFTGRAAWLSSEAVTRAEAQAHHYSATGPPGSQLS